MLYISRFAGAHKYGVTDSEDGVEEIVTHQELNTLCIDLGIEIQGVNISSAYIKGKSVPIVSSVHVYQDAESLSKSQVKLKMLAGVDMRIHNEAIVSMTVDRNVASVNTRVRLSDYGKSCCDYVFKMMNYQRERIITVVLDDKIEIGSKAVRYFPERGVRLDMREVSSSKVVDAVCRELSDTPAVVDAMEDFVIDRQDRLDYYTAVAVVNRPSNWNPVISSVADVVQDVDLANRLVSRKYEKEFKKLSETEIRAVKDMRWIGKAKTFAPWLSSHYHIIELDDFDLLMDSNMMNIFGAMREMSTLNKSALLRFENYLQLFDVSESIKQAYISFCKRAGHWILVVARKKKWLT